MTKQKNMRVRKREFVQLVHMMPEADHPTVSVVIESAMVDKEMVPLVRWMNSFGSIRTLVCCQGELAKKNEYEVDSCHRPYVAWTCSKQIDLARFLVELRGSAETDVSFDEESLMIVYRTAFVSLNALRCFIESIEKRKKYRESCQGKD